MDPDSKTTKPMARRTIEEKTTISPRSQRRYQRLASAWTSPT
jgi:hypothetical protein